MRTVEELAWVRAKPPLMKNFSGSAPCRNTRAPAINTIEQGQHTKAPSERFHQKQGKAFAAGALNAKQARIENTHRIMHDREHAGLQLRDDGRVAGGDAVLAVDAGDLHGRNSLTDASAA